MTHDLQYLTRNLEGCTITAAEAVRKAADWWDKTGRHLMNKQANVEDLTRYTPGTGKAPAIRVKDSEVVIPSKILQGHEWAELDRREKALIVEKWLKEYRSQYAAAKH